MDNNEELVNELLAVIKEMHDYLMEERRVQYTSTISRRMSALSKKYELGLKFTDDNHGFYWGPRSDSNKGQER